MSCFLNRCWLCLLVLLACLGMGAAALAETESGNPLLTPPVIEEYLEPEDSFMNVLLLGIDYGGRGYYTSGGKTTLSECHTDGAVVAALNLTKDELHLISIPRDSLTYVPGVRGIYKYNAAINCGGTIEEGLRLACEAASWHLGGVRIDHYVAIDASALIALGNAIGGVDFEVDMNYEGYFGAYKRGMQHLTGEGIADYMSARQNATVESSDLGRTRRQRDMLAAIFAKLKREPALLLEVLDVYRSGKVNILTDYSVLDALETARHALTFDLNDVAMHVLTGKYRPFGMNFTFNDQENRQQVIKTVYGLDVPQIEYVSYRYTRWLEEAGLLGAKSINIGRSVLAHARVSEAMTAEQKTLCQELDSAIDACIEAFDTAAKTYAPVDTDTMLVARRRMKEATEAAAQAFAYPEPINWTRPSGWYRDPMINEITLNWN